MKYLFIFLMFFRFITVDAQEITSKEKMQWWEDAKFGLFLHWGLYSATAGDWKGHKTSRGEQFMMVEKIPVKEYATIADTFNPVHFDAEKWALMAKNAGMKYVVITAKHHDGFAMYDSRISDYNIVKKTPFARDPLRELENACHRHGLKFGFYYSLGRDWEDPDAATNSPQKGGRSNTWDFPDEDAKDVTKYYYRKALPQIKELVTNFGPIDILWFDTPELTPAWESANIMDTIHKYQPRCIVNNRIGNKYGDYSVYEQSIVKNILAKPWEACVTISANWAYNRHDVAWKSSNVLIRQLVDVVSKGGNYLLNLSPKGDGSFAPQALERIDSVGKWLKVNGEAIYNTKPWSVYGSIDTLYVTAERNKKLTAAEKDALDAVNDNTNKTLYPMYRFTQSDKALYLILSNPINNNIEIPMGQLGKYGQLRSLSLLGYEKTIKWSMSNDNLTLQVLSKLNMNIPVYVFKLSL